MGKVIANEELDEHVIKKFTFGALDVPNHKHTPFDENVFPNTLTPETAKPTALSESTPITPAPGQEASALLEKIENLTNENITLQMSLETLQKEFDEKLHEGSEKAYQQGKEEGIKSTQETLQEHNEDLNTQLIKSITLLDEQLLAHETYLANIQEELIDTAIIIAEKIIKKELSENAHEVAISLADSLLKELQKASHVTIKANPKDVTYLQEHYTAQKKIQIDSDDAINKGGIIILTDIGNIDGTIDTRVQKAIALIERED